LVQTTKIDMTNILKRTWCKCCQDYTLFAETASKQAICKTCETHYEEYTLESVPSNKVTEQRARYAEYKRQEFQEIMAMLQSGGNLANYMPSNIVEDDAGQNAIDAALRAEAEAKRAAELEYKSRFRGLGRNDKCQCGSGKKYKKCCLPLVEQIR